MRGGAPSLALMLAGAAAFAAPQALEPLPDAQGRIAPPWHVVGLPHQKVPMTRFSIEDGALRIDAEASYGNLVHTLGGRPLPEHLAWSWRIVRANPQADLRTRLGDDLPVKVCMGFDLPIERVPFMERQLLRLARSMAHEPVPAATLCWVWDGHEAAGTVLPNAFTRRLRYLVVRGRGDPMGDWRDERRDVAADFRAAFGDEATEPPPPVALMVGGDADNTGATTLAYVRGLRIEP